MDYVDMDFAADVFAALSEDMREAMRDRAWEHVVALGIEPTETLIEELAIHLTQRALLDFAALEEIVDTGA